MQAPSFYPLAQLPPWLTASGIYNIRCPAVVADGGAGPAADSESDEVTRFD